MGLRQTTLPDDFRNELARLVRAGFPLLPLGGGADGKTPLIGGWAGPKMTLARVLAPLYRSGAQVFGIRLDGLAVIDCDSDDPALVAEMEARFGPSPVHVKTPRGLHLYYLLSGKPPNLRAEGLPVDIKSGPRAYVVGPGSIRPDWGRYSPAKGLLGVDALPPLRAPVKPQNKALGAAIPVGNRHNELVKEAVAMVELVDSAEELEANLMAVRDDLCQEAGTMPDSEVRGIADWAWRARLENRIFRGRDSAVSLHRLALDALRRWNNETDAIGLYVLLTDMHGHSPGKRFALDFAAMRASGLTRLSIPRLRAARRTLQAVGLLMLVGNHRAGSVHQTFVLARLRPDMIDAPNIARLPSSSAPNPPGKKGGRG
ncbi:DNA primase/polymerase, bifunctional, N-terminal [Paracoccaceae bacterium]